MSSTDEDCYDPVVVVTSNNNSRPQAWLDGLLWCVVSILDYLWCGYQRLVHTIRDRFLFYNNNSNHSTRSSAGNRNNINSGRNSRNRCNSLPELEDCSLSAGHHHRGDCCVSPLADATTGALLLQQPQQQQHEKGSIGPITTYPEGAVEIIKNTSSSSSSHSEQQPRHEIEIWDWGPIPVELEPAFLTERLYPSDWLVYHPTLRVIPRTAAQQQQSPENGARYSAKHGIMPVGNNGLASPSCFEDEKKDDNIAVGHDSMDEHDGGAKNAAHLASTSRPLESSTETLQRQTNETSRRMPTNNSSKADMPILRSVVAI